MHPLRRLSPRTAPALLWLLVGLVACSENDVAGNDEGIVEDLFPRRDVWTPSPGTSWQWQLIGPVDSSFDVEVYDVDLFDTPKSTVDALKAQGRKVIAYFSAGSFEDWRPDARQFPASVLGNPLQDFDDERWLDIRSPALRAIMEARLDLAVAKGFDAVEPDNVDGHINATGFDLTPRDQLVFLAFLANAAHARGLSVGLKNALDLIEHVEHLFEWALNEQCLEADECAALQRFLDADKAVFHVEYANSCQDLAAEAVSVCGHASVAGFSTLVKTLALDACGATCQALLPDVRPEPFRIRRGGS